jgi:hypothetical protein
MMPTPSQEGKKIVPFFVGLTQSLYFLVRYELGKISQPLMLWSFSHLECSFLAYLLVWQFGMFPLG